MFCIIGPVFAGKTRLAKHLCDRYNISYFSLQNIKTKLRAGRKIELTDNVEIVNALVKKLQYLKSEYRVFIDGFPENID